MMKVLRIQAQGSKTSQSARLSFTWNEAQGKGSHGTLSVGDKSTTLKDLKKEIGPGLLKAMCAQLGIKKEDL
jgi:mRNA interferase HicA